MGTPLLNEMMNLAQDAKELHLYAENAADADFQITALSNRRAKIAQSLENFRKAAQAFLGAPDVDVVIGYLHLEPDEFRDQCIRRYMELKKLPKELDPATFALSLTTDPPEVAKIMQAHHAARSPLSSDPMRYWDPQKKEFVFIGVSIEEANRIRERCRDYVADQATAEAYNFVKTFCLLYNRLPAVPFRTSIKAKHDLTSPLEHYIRFTTADAFNMVGLSNPGLFEVKHEMFITPTEAKKYVAFDEK